MSLRYKALIAVIALIALLTGALAFTSGRHFEEDARARIQRDLDKDAAFLNAQIIGAARTTRTALEGSANSREIVELFTNPEYRVIGGNLKTFSDEWLLDSDADIAIAALDTFLADEREVTVSHEIGDLLSVASISSRTPLTTELAAAIVNDPELKSFVVDFYKPLFDGEPDMRLSAAAVLPIAGSVYLVVQTGLFESIQERLAAGIGVVLIELSQDWLKRSVPVAGDDRNPVEKLVFTGQTLTASTLPRLESAEVVLQTALDTPGTNEGRSEQFSLTLGNETFLGIAISSDLAPQGMTNRPGFITIKSLDREFAPFVQARRALFIFAAALALVMALVAYFGVYLEIAKLRRLEDATIRVRQGQFDTKVAVRGRDEIAKLTKAFNDMTTGLKALGMYTHETLARDILDNPEKLGLYSARAEGSVFFTDIVGFTSIAETMSAEDLTTQLNEYFEALGEVLRDQRGYVDKFIGDSVMAFWGPPFVREEDYALRAVRSALGSVRALERLQVQWRKQGRPLFHQRIGVATGEVVVGNIGTANKKNFTVIGDSVNLASRLEGTNKYYGTQILVDARTAELLGRNVLLREVDQLRVVGRNEPVGVYEPVALAGEETSDQRHLCETYAAALAQYRSRDFAGAIETLKGKKDGPSRWLAETCKTLANNPPSADWQPVTTATSK